MFSSLLFELMLYCRGSGVEYELALAALRRGDRVIATTRQSSISQLQADHGLDQFGTMCIFWNWVSLFRWMI